jgi:hypothetical protein
MTQSETGGDLMKVGSAHQVSLHFRKAAFGIIGIARHQGFAGQEAKNRIAQKFELLVVGGRFGGLLVYSRFVSQRPFEQFPVFELVTENFFYYFELGSDRLVGAVAACSCSKD